MPISLRPYQNDGVSRIRDCFRRLVNRVLFVLPTGGGKTVIFTYIAQKMSQKNKKVLILVHRIELLRQTSNALLKFDVEHGMINPLYTPNFEHHVQVASVQTIIKRLNYFSAVNWIPDLIIVDEAHHATAGSWRKVIEHFQLSNENLKVKGVTATPIRTDGQGLGKEHNGIFDELVCGPSMRWLMDEGFLVRPKVLSPPKKFDASNLKRSKGDFNKNDLENLINKPTITGDVVSHYEQVCKGAPTIVFCVSVAHTEEVAREFRNAGYRFYAIDGNTDDDVRKQILNGLLDGSVQGVCSCDLINEGTDVPAATCGIMLRLTASLSLYLQQVGRILRPVYAEGYDLATREGRLASIAASNKPYAYLLDHVGNVGSWVNNDFIENHGLPEKEHVWSLEGEVKNKRKKKTETAVRVQQCLSCFAVHEPAPICPECGHVYEVKDRTPKRSEGNLQEVTAEMITKKQKRQEVAKTESLDDLLKIASERGYRENWAHIQYDLKQKKQREKLARLERLKPIEFPPMPTLEITKPVNNDFSENLDF